MKINITKTTRKQTNKSDAINNKQNNIKTNKSKKF